MSDTAPPSPAAPAASASSEAGRTKTPASVDSTEAPSSPEGVAVSPPSRPASGLRRAFGLGSVNPASEKVADADRPGMAVDPDDERTHPMAPVAALVRRGFLVAVVFSFFINLLMLALPLYMMQLFDRVLTSRSIDTLIMLTIIVMALFIVQGLLGYIRSGLLTRVGMRVDLALSATLFQRGLHRAFERGSASAQGLRDLSEVRAVITGNAITALFDIPWTPVFLTVCFLFHWVLGVVALVGTLVLIGLAVLNALMTRNTQDKGSEIAMGALHRVEGYLRAAEVINAMGLVPGLKQRWEKSQTRMLDFQRQTNDRANMFSNLSKWARLVLQASLFCAGVTLVIQEGLTPGVMIASSIIMARALAPVETAIGGWRSLVSGHKAWKRLREHLAESAPLHGTVVLPRPEGRIVTEKLYYTIPGTDTHILKGINLELTPGEALGIVGPTGAGKSTLARLLIGLHRPTLGSVRLDGADVAAWSPDERGRYIGYVPQEPLVVAGTVRDNICRYMDAKDAEVIAAAKLAGIHEMVLRLPKGYDTLIGEGGLTLSGGQRQRLALARALFGKPSLLVLDEPTVHLDPTGEENLLRALGAVRNAKITLVVISHRVSLISRLDRLIVLRDGRIERSGTPAEVAKQSQSKGGAATIPVEGGSDGGGAGGGPAGAGPSGTGPSGTGPSGTGPSGAGPSGAGSSGAGPSGSPPSASGGAGALSASPSETSAGASGPMVSVVSS